MADLNTLTIQINADATKAEQSLDKLIESLQRLNMSLDLGNLSHFTQQLQSIRQAAEGMKDIGSGIKSVADAGSKLSQLTGVKTLTDQTKEAESALRKLAEETAHTFRFDLSGTKEARRDIDALYNDLKKVYDSFSARGGQFGEFDSVYLADSIITKNNAVDEWKKIVAEMDEYKELSDYIRNHPLTLNSGMKEDFLGGRQFKEVFDLFGHKLNFSKDGLLDLTEYFEELQRLTGYVPTGDDMYQKFQNLISFLEKGQEGLREAVVHGRDVLAKGLIPQDMFVAEGEKLAQNIANIYERVRQEDVKNPFDGIVNGLRSLQEITLPDFSGLNALAEGIKAISGVNVKKLTDIAEALKLFKDTGFTSLNVTNDGATAKTEAEFVNIRNTLGDIRTSLQQIATVMTEFSGMGSVLAAGFEEFKEAATGTAEIIASIHEALIAIGYDVEGLPSLFDAFGAGRNAEMSAELLQAIASFTELIKIADVAKNSMESLSTAIDGLKGKVGEIPVKTEIDKTGKAAEQATEKLSTLDKKVKEIFESGWTQDSLSAEIARSISDIDRFKAAMSDMTKKPEIFDAQQFIHFSQQVEIAERVWKNFQQSVARKVRIGGGLDEASKQLQFIIDRRHDVQEALSNMDSGKVGANVEQYRALREELAKLDDEYARLTSKKEEFEKPTQIDLLANLVALGHEIGKISNSLNRIGDVGIKALKVAFKPLDYVIKEYKEKINGLADAFRHMSQSAKKQLDKLSAFWRRSMKTFTFMLVRKAITAVLTEVGDAVKSLALWSKQFGTVFNDSMSHITSNLSYMARAIVGAFEPLINFVTPIMNAMADAFANLAARVGEFFAALTGQDYYMRAKKQVTDYAESVDKARKAQKNLIAGLDDLNVITTPTSTDTGMDDVAEQWEKMDVSDWAKDLAEKIKNIAKRLFDPIQKAWDKVGEHVKDQFRFMWDNLKKMFADIGRDFLDVWNEEATQKILEKIFSIIGNIAEGIGWIARRFNEAWNNAGRGKKILQNIRDIIGIIVDHVYNMSEAFVEFAKGLTFDPLLKSLENMLRKIQPFIDFLGSLLEEWFKRVILRHWEWLIEVGIPHLLDTISEIAEAFHWDKILDDLKPVMDAFETMRENIETGLVNAFGNLGKRVAEFANSEDFTNFTANVAWFMEQITAERVEKLFTALGDAILNVAESLMRFVGSDTFKDFMQKIFDWYDSLSTEDIAGFITDIAIAIAAFKFTAFIGTGLAKFFEFLSVLQGLKGLGGVSGLLGGASGGASIGATLTALGTAAAVIAAVIAAIYSLVESFGGIQGTLEEVGKHIAIIKDGLSAAFENSGIADSIANLKEKFGQLLDALGNQQSLWQALFYIIDGLAVLLGDIVIPVFGALIDAFAASFEVISGLLDLIGGLFDMLKGFFTGDSQLISDGWARMCQGFKDAFQGVFDLLGVPGGLVHKLVLAIADFFSWLKKVLIGDPIVLDTTDGIISAFAGMVKDVTEAIAQFVADMVEKFIELKDKVLEKVQELKEKVIQKFKELKDKVLSKIQELKEKAIQKFNELKNTVISRIEEMKNNVLSKVEEMKNNVISKAEELKNNAVARFNQLKDDATSAVENLKSNAISAFENLKSNVVGIAESASRDASQWFWQLNDWASDAFWSIVNGAGSILGNIGSTISGAFSGIKSTVQGAFSGASTWLQGVGQDIADGLSSGIKSASNSTSFYKNTSSLGQMVENITRKVTKTHSPSRVFIDIGKDIVDGLDVGIQKNEKNSAKVVEEWVKSAIDVDIPKLDASKVLPKDNLKLDTYAHTQFSGTVDSTAIQQGVREGVQEAIGSLILPYLNDIAQSSRETAAKEIKIGDKAIGQAASRYAKDYQIRTGRPAYGY